MFTLIKIPVLRKEAMIAIAVFAVSGFMFLPGTTGAEEFPVRAPEALPGTTEEMNSPDFWIDRIDDPDRVIMTASQINAFNKKNMSRNIAPDHPYAKNITKIERDGPVFNRMTPLGIGETYPAKPVKERLKQNIDRLLNTTLYDRWALPFTDTKKTEIREAVNLEAVPEIIRPKKAVIIRHTSARLYPTAEPGYRMRNYLDDINVTSLDIGMPVAVLHVSKNGEFCFIMSPIAWGWVPAQDIAFGSTEKIRELKDAKKFIVITDHKVPLYADEEFSTFIGSLYMGERLPVVSKTADSFCVSVPVRDFDGSLVLKKGRVRNDETVCEGFLPCTKRNVITTAFRLLGRPYGWHDSWDERDCGGIMRVIFNCFGITLPRYWSFQQLCSDNAEFVGDITEAGEKAEKLCAMPEGITLTGKTGHIGLYLGNIDSKPYVIHQCGWNYKEGDTEYKMARVVVSDYEHVGFDMKTLQFFTPVMP